MQVVPISAQKLNFCVIKWNTVTVLLKLRIISYVFRTATT